MRQKFLKKDAEKIRMRKEVQLNIRKKTKKLIFKKNNFACVSFVWFTRFLHQITKITLHFTS